MAFTFYEKNTLTGIGNNKISTELIAGDYVVIFDNTGLTGDNNPNSIKLHLTVLFIDIGQNILLQLEQVIDIKGSDYSWYFFEYQEIWDLDRVSFQLTKTGTGPITMSIIDASELVIFEEELEIFRAEQKFNNQLVNFVFLLFIIMFLTTIFILIFLKFLKYSSKSNKKRITGIIKAKRSQKIGSKNISNNSLVFYCGNCGQPIQQSMTYCEACGTKTPN